jgi:hypothetical protein
VASLICTDPWLGAHNPAKSVTVMNSDFGCDRRTFLRVLSTIPLAANASWAAERPKVALWVWGEPVLAPGNLLAFAAAQQIDTLFIYLSPAGGEALLSGNAAAIANIAALRSDGRKIYALGGEPDWAHTGSRLPPQASLLVRLATTTRLFDGLQLDIEPHAMAEWRSPAGQASLMNGTLEFFDRLRAAAPGVVLDAAVNPIYATISLGSGTFLSALAGRVASLSIMAYRLPLDRALDWAAPSIAQAAHAGLPWRMGVLVHPDPGETRTSWFGASAASFTSAMQQLDATIASRFVHSGYAGLAVEDYAGLMQMISTPQNGG